MVCPDMNIYRRVCAVVHHVTHSALVRFLPGVSAHMNHQHVLRFKGLLFARALLPAAHKLLLLPVDVFVIDVL